MQLEGATMVHTVLDRAPRVDPDPGRSRRVHSAPEPDFGRRVRFDAACTALEAARDVIARGWLQHGWYLAQRPRPRSLRERLRQADRPPTADEVHSACLVAAVALAAHGGGPRLDVFTDAAPALDLVWDALWETRGHRGPPVAGRAAAPAVRAARMQDLVRWNDDPERSRADVLALLDRALSRGILAAVGAPVGQRPAVSSAIR